MFLLKAFLFFTIGGLAGRIRGQTAPWGDTISRYGVWGVSVGVLVAFGTHNILWGLVAVLLAGAGSSIGYWGQFDFTAPGNWNIKNYALLTATGMYRFLPLFIAACCVGEEWRVTAAVLLGVTFVPIYMFCSKYMQHIEDGALFTSWTCWAEFTSWTCWAEFLFWGTIYSALAAGLFV